MFLVILWVLGLELCFCNFEKYRDLMNRPYLLMIIGGLMSATIIINSLVPIQFIQQYLLIVLGGALLIFWFTNKRLLSIFFLALAAFGNGAVKAANGGNMLVSHAAHVKMQRATHRALNNDLDKNYKFAGEQSRLNILGDNFYFEYAGVIFSLGDICLMLSLLQAQIEIRFLKSYRCLSNGNN